MSTHMYFFCEPCKERYNDVETNWHDDLLVNIIKFYPDLKKMQDATKGELEFRIFWGNQPVPMEFLAEHQGEGHRLTVISEYGDLYPPAEPAGVGLA